MTSEDKVAIVTGASSGIGRETAIALARRGYRLVLGARRREKLEAVARACRDAGGQAEAVVTDVARQEQVESLVSAAVDTFGGLDVMVNNAGIGLRARVHETTDEQMRSLFDVNYYGVFYGCLAAGRVMRRRRGGHIFNVSSVIGKRGAPFHGAYCATKAAICGLTDALRVEMKPCGVRVTCVCPVLTETEFFDVQAGRTPRSGRSFARLRGLMPAAVVGRKIAATVGKPTPELIFTVGGKFLTVLAALSPRLTDALMTVYHDELAKDAPPRPTG